MVGEPVLSESGTVYSVVGGLGASADGLGLCEYFPHG